MDVNQLIETLHPLERKVVPHLSNVTQFLDLVQVTGLKDVEVMRALQWLQNKGVVTLKDTLYEEIKLDKFGELYFKIGLPEKRFLDALEKPLLASVLKQKAELNEQEFNICTGLLKKQDFISLKKEKEILISLTDKGRNMRTAGLPLEHFINSLAKPRSLSTLTSDERNLLDTIKSRQDLVKIDIKRFKSFQLTDLGKKLTTMKLTDTVVDAVTSRMLKEGSWQGKKFRRYDVSINVPPLSGGRRHFVQESIKYIKRIWLDMGFKEMQGNMVHTAFWDLDALFVPQDHPARTMQDTFYLGDKKIMLGSLPDDYKQIQSVHEHGGKTGSTGWRSSWSPEEAKQLLLRTHTTVLSALKLHELTEKDLPAKFFNVGKVFRNEALDWKHQFEFYQVDGIVIDPQANFKHLKGYLRQFFMKMGYPDVRIRPAHFPYTEPSVEVDVLHPIKKEWVELGGAGIFRPEVVQPLLGKDVPVLAWGLGFGRIISEYYSITDIRDLDNSDFKKLREIKLWTRGIV